MTVAELTHVMVIVAEVLGTLALLAIIVWVGRRAVERNVRAAMAYDSDNLVGKRAIAVNDLRPKRIGSIRPYGSKEEEMRRATQADEQQETLPVYPAVADELISSGRVVRVIGGDQNGYIVRPLNKSN